MTVSLTPDQLANLRPQPREQLLSRDAVIGAEEVSPDLDSAPVENGLPRPLHAHPNSLPGPL